MKKLVVLLAVLCLCVPLGGCKNENGVGVEGSTSASKLIGALSEAYENENGITVTYSPTGSGAGISAVLEGRCDIGLSSRELKNEEKAKGLTATVIAYDGITVIVNTENKITDLCVEEIEKIFIGEITNWNEVGGEEGEIVLIGREAGSGTRDGFESAIGCVDKCKYRRELNSNGDVITAVSSNVNAVGYASIAAIKNSVKTLSVGGILPSEGTIKDGSYTVQRPFVLVTKENVRLSEQAQRFFDYAISDRAREIISSVGFVPAVG